MTRTTTTEVTSEPSFRHEALLYDDLDEFVDRTARFVEDGVEGGQPVMVVVSGAKIDRLRNRLGSAASVVHFADMDDVGTNPARIIPAWQDFVDEWGSPGEAVRGVGEPLHPDRDPDAVVECRHHEALLNVAFAAVRFWLVCPFDREALAPDVTAGACDTHPWVSHHGVCTASPSYDGDHVCDTVLDDPLPPAPPHTRLTFTDRSFREVRAFVTDQAAGVGLAPGALDDLALAVSEAATNSVLHGGGGGEVGTWVTTDAFVCEVVDRGWIRDPMAGRVRPTHDQGDGRGLWIINQVCDLVQLRSSPAGTTVRMHLRRSR